MLNTFKKRNQEESFEFTEQMKEEQTAKIEKSILNLIDTQLIWKLSETQKELKLADIVSLDDKGSIIDRTEELKLDHALSLNSNMVKQTIQSEPVRNEDLEILAMEEKIANLRKECFTLKVPDSHPIQVNNLELQTIELDDLKRKYLKQAQ